MLRWTRSPTGSLNRSRFCFLFFSFSPSRHLGEGGDKGSLPQLPKLDVQEDGLSQPRPILWPLSGRLSAEPSCLESPSLKFRKTKRLNTSKTHWGVIFVWLQCPSLASYWAPDLQSGCLSVNYKLRDLVALGSCCLLSESHTRQAFFGIIPMATEKFSSRLVFLEPTSF